MAAFGRNDIRGTYRDPLLTTGVAEAGITATERGSLAHQRLTQIRDFYHFLREEIPALLTRCYARSASTTTSTRT